MKNKFGEIPSNPGEEDDEELISYGIERAQEIARQRGFDFKIGQIVGHPNDDTAYALKKINGNMAVVWNTGRKETIKEFPLNELFDPKVARAEAIKKDFSKRHPGSNN